MKGQLKIISIENIYIDAYLDKTDKKGPGEDSDFCS